MVNFVCWRVWDGAGVAGFIRAATNANAIRETCTRFDMYEKYMCTRRTHAYITLCITRAECSTHVNACDAGELWDGWMDGWVALGMGPTLQSEPRTTEYTT